MFSMDITSLFLHPVVNMKAGGVVPFGPIVRILITKNGGLAVGLLVMCNDNICI